MFLSPGARVPSEAVSSGAGAGMSALEGGFVGGEEHSLSEGLQQITGGAQGTFDETRHRAGRVMESNTVDASLQAVKASDPDAGKVAAAQKAFSGLRSMAFEGTQTVVGDMVAALPGLGGPLESTFSGKGMKGFFSQTFGKMAPGVTAMEAAKQAKDQGII